MKTLRNSRLIAVLITVACIAVATLGLRLSEPTEYESSKARLGEPAEFLGGSLTVEKVRVGTILTREGELQLTTEGLFVVVTVTVAAREAKVSASDSVLVSDKYRYDAIDGFDLVDAEPGFQTTKDLVFEVDPHHMADLALESRKTELIVGYHERALVSLGITKGNAEQWWQAGKGREVDYARFETVRVVE